MVDWVVVQGGTGHDEGGHVLGGHGDVIFQPGLVPIHDSVYNWSMEILELSKADQDRSQDS